MPKKKTGRKDQRVHAAAPVRPLCGAKSAKVSRTPQAITCEACGKAAQRLVAMAEEGANVRQEAALASAQPPRWWQVDEVLTNASKPGDG